MMRRLLCGILALLMVVCLLPLDAIHVSAASSMKASDAIIQYIKSMEGFDPIPHWDYHQWTVGYGSRCPDEHLERYLEEGIPIEEADALFLEELATFEERVNAFIDKFDLQFAQNQFDALVSISYNLGASWMNTDNDLRRAVLEDARGNSFTSVLSQRCTAGGKYLSGLMRRRITEAEIYLYGRYDTQIPDNYAHVFFNAGEGKATAQVQGYDCNLYAVPLVTASREGYTFLGWYTEETGGVKITYLDENLHQDTLYAHWQEGDGEYKEDTTVIPDGVKVTITGDSLNVRSGPGIGYPVVGYVVYGEEVIVTEIATAENGRLWGKFEEGWISLAYTDYQGATDGDQGSDSNQDTQTDPIANLQLPILATITGSGPLNLYNGPDEEYPKIGTLELGTEVKIVETYKMFKKWWARLETGGWICIDLRVVLHDDQKLAHHANVTITRTSVNVRSGPGSENGWLGALSKGDVVEILAVEMVDDSLWGRYSGGWFALQYSDFDMSRLDYYRNHVFGPWFTDVESTCVTPGHLKRECLYCDRAETQELPLGDHSMGQWYVAEASTCVTQGQERRDCQHCDYYETRALELSGHTLGEWYETIAPTLTDCGEERRDCLYCDYYETRVTDPVEHLYGEWYVYREATCTEEGEMRRDCTDCDHYESKTIAANGHDYGDWYVTVEPTYQEDGQERRDCKNCDHYETRVKEFEDEVVVKIYATVICEALNVRSGPGTGYSRVDTVYYGSVHEVFEQQTVDGRVWGRIEQGWICLTDNTTLKEVVEEVGHTHSFGEWYTVTEATATQNGQERRDCACGYYETRETVYEGATVTRIYATITISSLSIRSGPGSSYSRVGYAKEGEVYEIFEQATVGSKIWGRTEKGWICLTGYTTLEEVTESVGHTHSFGDWFVSVAATCTTDGEKRRECACGHYETEVIAATGHSFGEWYTVTEATATQNGQERRDCACGYYETRETVYEGATVTRIYATITISSLSIRSGPGSSYSRVGYAKEGEVYEIFEQATVGSKIWGRTEKGWICLTGYTTLEEVTESVGHTHSFGDWFVSVAATCTTDGEKRRECACGHYETEVIAATGHSFGQWYTVTEATATQNGQERRDCACGYYETRETVYEGATVTRIYATITVSSLSVRDGAGSSHKWIGYVKRGEVYEVFEQTTVGSKIWGRIEKGWICLTGYTTLEEVTEATAHSHSFGQWYTVTEATATQNGQERRDCACGHYETRETEYQGATATKIYATITVSTLNVRSGAGSNYSWVACVKRGEVYEVFEQTTVGNKVWGRTVKGWICLTGYTTLREVAQTRNDMGANCIHN